ncbi:MAG: ethanolamine ammonia-lyase subunit EutC, partial [Cytophagales bacterium]|nr:ethanolamine ammonia-lyase subunit EutC [Cytophagales bacterium]
MESGNADGWEFLRQYTGARIALGRAGTSIRTKDLLEFQWAHALARDAVREELDTEKLTVGLSPFFSSVSVLQSKVSSK